MKFNITVEHIQQIKEYKNIQAENEKELRQWFIKSNIKGTLESITHAS